MKTAAKPYCLSKQVVYEIDKELKSLNEIKTIDFGVATHNICFFNINDKLIGIGGQPQSKEDLLTHYKKKYPNFINNPDNFINATSISDVINVKRFPNNKIIKPNVLCPFSSNGLNLFELDINNIPDCPSPKYLLLSPFHEGRHDGYYANNNWQGKNGMTAFDSGCSLVYNKKQQLYYLFVRANIMAGCRIYSIYYFK